MADILINVRQNDTFDDGDVILAYTDADILRLHAERLCARVDRRAGVYLSHDTLFADLTRLTSRYRYDRISARDVRRTDLATGAIVERDAVEFLGVTYTVDDWIARRLRHVGHRMFGVQGAEIWYSGQRATTASLVWDAIEARTTHTRTASIYARAPLTPAELSGFLVLRVSNMTRSVADALLAPVMAVLEEGSVPEPVRTRRYRVLWREALQQHPATAATSAALIADVLNAATVIDMRETATFPIAQIIQEKAV